MSTREAGAAVEPSSWGVSAAGAGWHENGPGGPWRWRPWTALWRSRELIGHLALRDVKLRYRQALLGVVWVLLLPLSSVVVFTVVFRRLAGADSEGVAYPLFALVGVVAWTYFSNSTSRASEALVSNPNLVTKVSFPRIAAPAAGLASPLLDLAVSSVLVGALLVHYRTWGSWRLLALPLCLVLLVATAFGVALWLSALNVRYRDVQHALGPLLQLWFFASPVAYSASALPERLRLLYAVNPMTGVIALARWSVLGTAWPGWTAAVSVGVAALVLAGGLAYFQSAERGFADVV